MNAESRSDLNRHWVQIVAKAWSDDAFKQRMLADPAAVLAECGIPVPAGVTIKAVENTSDTVYLTLPAKPEGLTKETLDVLKSDFDWGRFLGIVPPILGSLF